MKRTFLYFLILVILVSRASAQDIHKRSLGVGADCPDVSLQIKSLDTEARQRISDYRGKLLILDFWATWCSPCRAFLRQADSLNQVFAGKAVILPVTEEDTTVVLPFLRSYRKFTGISLTSVIRDTVLERLFYHKYIPHEVWIDTSGKVIAATSITEVNASNIQDILDGKPVNLKTKDDRAVLNVDYNKQVLTGPNKVPIPDSLVLFRDSTAGYEAILTKFCPYFISMGGITLKGDLFHVFNMGANILYLWTAGGFSDMNESQIIMKSRDSAELQSPTTLAKNLQWILQNGYCFEIHISDTSLNSKKFDIALDILNDYFKRKNVVGYLSWKKTDTYVFEKRKGIQSLSTAGGEEKKYDNPYQLSYHNVSFYTFFYRMQRYYLQFLKYPLVNETGLGKGLIDIDLNCNLENLDAVNKAMRKYGLKIRRKKRKQLLLILKSIK
ncbi:MAG: TlpA disulfide reductase family protein [Puia sp.]|nr:TlpA disulfide reductase family protein [Puia sp.]